MGRFKQISKSCVKCGVEWNETLSNKQKCRALCIACYEAEGIERRQRKTKYDREHKIGMDRTEKYKDYKVANRQPFWTAINKEIRLCKSREDIRAFVAKQMDRILSDQQLMDYINDTNIIEKTK